MQVSEIQCNAFGLVRIRLDAPVEASHESVLEHARRAAARAAQAPVRFLYSVPAEDVSHDLLFAGPRPA